MSRRRTRSSPRLPLAPLAGRGWREAPGEGLVSFSSIVAQAMLTLVMTGWSRQVPLPLLVARSQRGVPIAVAIADHLDLPRLTTDGAVLHVRLPARAALIDVQLRGLAAVRAGDGKSVAHVHLHDDRIFG